MRASRARFISASINNTRATMKRIATPDSCGRLKNAQTKATITRSDVTMALIVANRIALFKSMARSFWRGMSLLRLVLEASSSLMAFNACDLSMMRFIRAISKEMNAATAPKRNEGAVTWAMTCASWMVDDVSEGMVH